MAVKFLPRGPEKVTKLVERELRSHSSFCHPHIILFKEVFLTPSHLAIVMVRPLLAQVCSLQVASSCLKAYIRPARIWHQPLGLAELQSSAGCPGSLQRFSRAEQPYQRWQPGMLQRDSMSVVLWQREVC